MDPLRHGHQETVKPISLKLRAVKHELRKLHSKIRKTFSSRRTFVFAFFRIKGQALGLLVPLS